MAVSVAPLTTAVMNSVGESDAVIASGINNAVSRTAGLLAIAIFGIAMLELFDHSLKARLAAVDVTPCQPTLCHRLAESLGLDALPVNLREPLEHRAGEADVSLVERALGTLANQAAEFADQCGERPVGSSVGGADARQLADRDLPVVALQRCLGVGDGRAQGRAAHLHVAEDDADAALLLHDARE